MTTYPPFTPEQIEETERWRREQEQTRKTKARADPKPTSVGRTSRATYASPTSSSCALRKRKVQAS